MTARPRSLTTAGTRPAAEIYLSQPGSGTGPYGFTVGYFQTDQSRLAWVSLENVCGTQSNEPVTKLAFMTTESIRQLDRDLPSCALVPGQTTVSFSHFSDLQRSFLGSDVVRRQIGTWTGLPSQLAETLASIINGDAGFRLPALPAPVKTADDRSQAEREQVAPVQSAVWVIEAVTKLDLFSTRWRAKDDGVDWVKRTVGS